jgi:hypothetical protein
MLKSTAEKFACIESNYSCSNPYHCPHIFTGYERNIHVRGPLHCVLALEVHNVDRCPGFVCVLALHPISNRAIKTLDTACTHVCLFFYVGLTVHHELCVYNQLDALFFLSLLN